MSARNYNCSDSELRLSAGTMSLAYEEDQAEFTAFNSVVFKPTFKADFDTAIQNAGNAANDEYVVDLQQQKTQNVNSKMELCRKAYFELIFSAKQAFPDNPNKWKIFGCDDYGKIGDSVKKMAEFMGVIHKGAVGESAVLVSNGGYTQPKIDNLATLGEQLSAAKNDQKNFMNKRPATTEERIDLHNKVFDIMKVISEAAANIFYGDDAKLKQYELPSSSGGTNGGDEEPPIPPSPNP